MAMTGSFQNRMAERATIGAPDPVVGMGATALYHSDREAWTVKEVLSPCRIIIQRDRIVAHDPWPRGTATTEPDPKGAVLLLRKNGRGQWKFKGIVFAVGYRSEYRDPQF